MATPLNQADIAGIADAILGRIIDLSVGMNPTTPQAADIQNGIDTGEDKSVSGIDRVINKFTDIMDNIGRVVASKIAQITIESKQPAADGSPRVAPSPGNAPSVSNAGVSPPPPPIPATSQPTPQIKLFATAEAQRESAASRTAQAMAGVSSSQSSKDSKLDELINAIRDSVRDKKQPGDKETRGSSSGGEASEGVKALGEVAKTILRTIIPISIAAAVLGSATSGMGTALSAFKVLGAVVGTVLTPFFIVLGAGFLSLADIISDSLIPNLEKWYTAFITASLEAINWLQKAVIDFVNEVLKLIPKIQEVGATFLEMVAVFSKSSAMILKQLDVLELNATGKDPNRAIPVAKAGQVMENAAKVIRDDLANKNVDKIPFKNVFEALNIPIVNGVPQIPKFGAGEGVAGRMPANIQKMIAQFKFDNAPQAQSMGLVQAAQNAQLAALNKSPFEQDMLKLVQQVVEALDKVSGKLKPPVGE